MIFKNIILLVLTLLLSSTVIAQCTTNAELYRDTQIEEIINEEIAQEYCNKLQGNITKENFTYSYYRTDKIVYSPQNEIETQMMHQIIQHEQATQKLIELSQELDLECSKLGVADYERDVIHSAIKIKNQIATINEKARIINQTHNQIIQNYVTELESLGANKVIGLPISNSYDIAISDLKSTTYDFQNPTYCPKESKIGEPGFTEQNYNLACKRNGFEKTLNATFGEKEDLIKESTSKIQNSEEKFEKAYYKDDWIKDIERYFSDEVAPFLLGWTPYINQAKCKIIDGELTDLENDTAITVKKAFDKLDTTLLIDGHMFFSSNNPLSLTTKFFQYYSQTEQNIQDLKEQYSKENELTNAKLILAQNSSQELLQELEKTAPINEQIFSFLNTFNQKQIDLSHLTLEDDHPYNKIALLIREINKINQTILDLNYCEQEKNGCYGIQYNKLIEMQKQLTNINLEIQDLNQTIMTQNYISTCLNELSKEEIPISKDDLDYVRTIVFYNAFLETYSQKPEQGIVNCAYALDSRRKTIGLEPKLENVSPTQDTELIFPQYTALYSTPLQIKEEYEALEESIDDKLDEAETTNPEGIDLESETQQIQEIKQRIEEILQKETLTPEDINELIELVKQLANIDAKLEIALEHQENDQNVTITNSNTDTNYLIYILPIGLIAAIVVSKAKALKKPKNPRTRILRRHSI